jgi:hypothetical protein
MKEVNPLTPCPRNSSTTPDQDWSFVIVGAVQYLRQIQFDHKNERNFVSMRIVLLRGLFAALAIMNDQCRRNGHTYH